jgi:eukaryotic-like serine/threonine-protein kinase
LTQGDPQEAAGVHEGQILAGKYRVEKVLGVGGMGVVVSARHIELDSRVALKFLLPSLLSNREAVARFAREARAAVKFHSEHVARVSDVGTLDNGAPYMVMEFLEGSDLSKWLQERGPLPIEQAVEFVLQACIAVADAHGIGIVHRDLKPANLFCVRRTDGQLSVKVLDFGISKLTDPSRASEPPGMSATKTSAVMGSPLYMSPEQVQSAKDVDTRTDIWALGVILFELVTGRVPFEGEAFGEIAVKIAIQTPAPIRTYRPDAPADLETVIAKCLAKDRNRRYANVAELAVALLPFAPKRAKGTVERITGIIQAAGLSESALAVPPSPQGQPSREETLLSPGSVTPGSVAPWSGTMSGRKSKKVLVWALTGTGVLGAAGSVALLGRSRITSPSNNGGLTQPPALAAAGHPTELPTASPTTTTETPIATIVPPPEDTNPTPQPQIQSDTDSPHPARHAQGSSSTLTVTTSPPTRPPVVTLPPRAKPDCDPNYFFDSQGQKHFKPECFK